MLALPFPQARMEILKIHASKLAKHGDIDYEAVVKLAENFNGADLRNVCTEAGMFAIRDERDYTVHEDFMKVRYRELQAGDLGWVCLQIEACLGSVILRVSFYAPATHSIHVEIWCG